MADEWQDYAPPKGNDGWQDFTPISLPSAASPIAPPTIAKPSALPMQEEGMAEALSGMSKSQDNAAANRSLQSLYRVGKGAAQGLYDVSTPGTFMSLLQKARPDLAAKVPLPQAGDIRDLPGKAVLSTVGMMGGVENQEFPKSSPRPITTPETTPVPSTPSPIPGILARHIPVVGRMIRTVEDLQQAMQSLGKDAPHPTSTTNLAPTKPGVSTYGMTSTSVRIPGEPVSSPAVPAQSLQQWPAGGTSEFAPSTSRPQGIPSEVVRLPVQQTMPSTISEADSLAKLQAMRKAALPQMPPGTAESGMDPIAQRAWQQSVFGEKPLEDIGAKARQANPEPTRAEVKGTPTQPPFPGPKNYEVTKGADPFTHTNAPQEWLAPKEYSSRIKQYGFDPNSQTISVMFKRGDVYHFKATQQMFNLMKNSSSEGEFLSQIEKMQPGLAGRKVGTVSLGGKQ